jgi:putative Mn2+ efflux pump MntP
MFGENDTKQAFGAQAGPVKLPAVRELLVTSALLLPLALDTFALGAALGIAGLEKKDRLRVSLVFTLFEAGMPILGIFIGRTVGSLVGETAGWGGIAALLLAGLLLLRPGGDETREANRLRLLAHARGLAIIDLGIGISVDELAIGLSAGLLALPIALMVIWIAVQAFVAAQVGLSFGARVGEQVRQRSEKAAGLALILMALVLLGLKLLNV